MKQPLWTHALTWIAAVVAALLLAFAGPEGINRTVHETLFSHGALAPR